MLSFTCQATRLLVHSGRKTNTMGSELIEQGRDRGNQTALLGYDQNTDRAGWRNSESYRKISPTPLVNCSRRLQFLSQNQDLAFPSIEPDREAFDSVAIRNFDDSQPIGFCNGLSSRKGRVPGHFFENSARRDDLVKYGREERKLANAGQRSADLH